MIRALLLLFAAGAVEAQERPVPPDAFLDAYEGTTLDFKLPDGSAFGREHWSSRARTIWRSPDGMCMSCDVFRRGKQLCFACDDGESSCWTHFEAPGGDIGIRSDGGVEAIGRRVGRAPPVCGGLPVS